MQASESAAGKYYFHRKGKPSNDGYGPAEDRIPDGCSVKKWQRENQSSHLQ